MKASKTQTFWYSKEYIVDKLKRVVRVQKDEKITKKSFSKDLAGFMMIFSSSHVGAEETIIQQEKISFEKCLKVITTSQDKLSVAPEITDVSDQKRVAVFTLVDGTLTIMCDGIEGNVTVSTNTN